MNSLPSIFLQQGEICIMDKPSIITTILGSCISITMFSPVHSTGAMCHAVMPENDGGERGRYLDNALEEMLDSFYNRGIKKSSLKLKLFGGARMFAAGYTKGSNGSVGDLNIRKALELIREHKLDLVASDVGGYEGRKIIFHPCNGSVWVKKFNRREIV